VKYKKQLTLIAIAFVLFFIVQQPDSSAGLVKDALGGLGHAADKLAVFVKSLVS
jgi:hypothetical protein